MYEKNKNNITHHKLKTEYQFLESCSPSPHLIVCDDVSFSKLGSPKINSTFSKIAFPIMKIGYELMYSCIAGMHLHSSFVCAQLDSENTEH